MRLERDLRHMESRTRRMWRENSNANYREPDFYTARGLGVPHRDLVGRLDSAPTKLLGETSV